MKESSKYNSVTARVQNITNMVALVIGSKYATLIELQTVYSFDDLLVLYECASVSAYNEWAVNWYHSKQQN